MLSDDIFNLVTWKYLWWDKNTKFSTVVVTSLIIPVIPFVILMAPSRISGATSDALATALDF